MGYLRAAESSQKNFTSITQEDMNQIENLHERAENLFAHHNFRDAINVYSEILLTEPDDDDAYTNIGQAYMVLGDFNRAKDAFQNALHINPDNEIAMFGLRKIADPDFTVIPGESAVPIPAPAPKPTATTTPISSDMSAILNSPLSFNQFVQIALQNAGLYDGPADGIMNQNTRKAIETFQKNNQIEVDGTVGPQTWSKLKPYLDKKH